MTLPEELKNKVVWAAFVAELAKEQGDSEWLNAGVVASFLEKKRKELKKRLMPVEILTRTKYKIEYKGDFYSVHDVIDAVFGGEGK